MSWFVNSLTYQVTTIRYISMKNSPKRRDSADGSLTEC